MNRHKPAWSRRRASIVLIIFSVALVSFDCSEETSVKQYKNDPPSVWISSGPPEGSLNHYEITFSWGGSDPDGRVSHFEYAITNNEGAFDPADTTFTGAWTKTTQTEDTFIFSADQLVDSIPDSAIEEFQRSHTFFVRAVDDEGLASRNPAYRSFTARTLSPTVSVTIPAGPGVALMPSTSTYRWTAVDYVGDLQTTQDPESISWILEPTEPHGDSYEETLEYIRGLPVNDPKWNERGGWVYCSAPRDGGKQWTTPPLADDDYVFAIRAKDEAGAITPVFDEAQNVRFIQVSSHLTGPTLRLRNSYMERMSTVLCDPPLYEADWPENFPVVFCWDATADHYGGVVAGYRYGWDISNPDDPDEWDIDLTPFTATQACSPPRTFLPGPHRFLVEVVDANGLCSRIEVLIHVVRFRMTRNLLVVDDFSESTQMGWYDRMSPGLQPSDREHDAFWEYALDDVAGFDPAADVIQVTRDSDLSLAQLFDYKSIIWSVYQYEQSLLHKYVKFLHPDGHLAGSGPHELNVIALFMAAGGHVLICGHQPVSAVIEPGFFRSRPRFPLMLDRDLGGYGYSGPIPTPEEGEGSFAYRDLCLETLDFAFKDRTRTRDASIVDVCPDVAPGPLYTLREHTMRAAIPVDLRFPRLELRVEAAGVGQWYHEDKRGLDVEVYNPPYFLGECPAATPPRDGFEPIYGVEMLDTLDTNYGSPVAFWTSAHADKVANAPGAVAARSAVFGFPPVYFEPWVVKPAIELILFDEWQLPRK